MLGAHWPTPRDHQSSDQFWLAALREAVEVGLHSFSRRRVAPYRAHLGVVGCTQWTRETRAAQLLPLQVERGAGVVGESFGEFYRAVE